MYDRIVVPLDGSERAEAALPYALRISAKAGAELVLASVSESPAETGQLYRSYLEKLAERVAAELSRQRPGEGARVQTKVLSGKTAEGILGLATESRRALIALTSHGGSGKGAWSLGNVASRILQASPAPVLVIKSPEPEEARDKGRLVTKILAPLDGSPAGAAAMPHIVNLARAFDAAVVLFHVSADPIPVLVAPGVEFAFIPPVSPAERARRLAAAAEYLGAVEKKLKEDGVKATSETASGLPAAEILNYAQHNAADLIGISSHGRSGIGRWVYGSIAEKVLQAATMPVLLARPGGS